jgi:hypothetical protein
MRDPEKQELTEEELDDLRWSESERYDELEGGESYV